MTRINVIPPEELTDQHLLAEYRELPRIFKQARIEVQPVTSYRMGPGHVRFFYGKTAYLVDRHVAIVKECVSRGYTLSLRGPLQAVQGLDGNWQPCEGDMNVNLNRLRERLSQKPGWYTHRGQRVTSEFYNRAAFP